ncbi:hypothetical protein CKM354_000089600 [Cercospora kikuchii]|uniref:DUF7730 domain-containing protein n=1 Tax=Cercospora kikuchii TaxID=84275 RepID=A0A9P3CCB9_9PEZI|nr:uncharacterized protein CKM354_000089600 [Cercospora kikuchii]GIZ37450.1 hypothetical protein CKM354_000089600 [Cercospora kikuchii]
MTNDQSPLFKLPAELREQIYINCLACTEQHAYCYWKDGVLITLVDGRIYKICTHTPHNLGVSLKCGAQALTLLRTCKAINNEASPIFHNSLELRLHIDGRYKSPTEIKGRDLGPVEDLKFMRLARVWDITVRLSTVEDLERLIAQIEDLRDLLKENKKIFWRSISVQISRYSECPEPGNEVLKAVSAMTGVKELEEIPDPWREGTTVFDYQASTKA